ncbi:MAG: ABC transporter ATP-binding protein [Pseudomonadota bacterium]
MSTAPPPDVIHVDALHYTYAGAETAAVRALRFDVRRGEVFGFLGPSGAGKSTTHNILIGHLRGYQGTVDVLGQPLAAWGGELYRQIGVSFEQPNHYLKLTARENLEYFRALYDGQAEPAINALERVGLAAHADRRVGEFSKGMKNRLNVARSLLHRPTLWFLDEPTAGLDPVNAVRIRELIAEQQARGVTVVLTTHDMTTADQVCDRVAFILDGQIVAIDAPAALRQRYGRRDVLVRWEGDVATPAGQASFPLDGLADDDAFAAALRQPGLAAVHSQEATLEEVFVAVTGRRLV